MESPAERRPIQPPPRAVESATPPPQVVIPPRTPGLTVAGVVVVVSAVSLVGLLLDAFTGGGLGWLFGGCFVAGSAYAASQVKRPDLAWAVVVPPVVFAVLVVGYMVLTESGGLLTTVVAGMNGLLDYGPELWLGTGVAAAIAGWRRWGDRVRRPRRP